MKNRSLFLWLLLAVLVSLLLVSCSKCEEVVCHECQAFDAAGNEVYYGNICYATKKDMRRNDRRARRAALNSDGWYHCNGEVVQTICDGEEMVSTVRD